MREWLESLVPWGTEVIVWVQSLTPEWLVPFFAFLTFLGYEEFYLILFPLIFWCLSKQIGMSLAYLSLLSAWLNSVIKYTFNIPRPSDPRIVTPYPETSPSFLSGHAQNAVINWGYLAYRLRNRVFWIVSILLILGIGLSRIVLGVHFPQDVIGGWLVGLILLLAYIWAEPTVTRWLKTQTMSLQLVLAIIVPIILIFLHPADTQGHYPAAGALTPMSTLVGLGVGFILERRWIRFRVDGEWWRRGVRYLLGLVLIAIFYVGPRFLLPEEMAYGLETGLRFVRYALLGWAVTFLAPWLFVRLRLAEQTEA
jgi:membrane-associated phospholipid phosphatase